MSFYGVCPRIVSSNKLPTPVQVSEESRDAAGVLLLNKLRKEDVVQEVAKETNHTAMNYVRKVSFQFTFIETFI